MSAGGATAALKMVLREENGELLADFAARTARSATDQRNPVSRKSDDLDAPSGAKTMSDTNSITGAAATTWSAPPPKLTGEQHEACLTKGVSVAPFVAVRKLKGGVTPFSTSATSPRR